MADTGAPWNIPYAEPADLVRDWPALSEDVADAVAAGLDSASLIKQVVQTVKTNTFSASIASGGTSDDVDGLTVSITPSSNTSKVLILATINLGISTSEGTSVTLFRAGTGVFVGDAAGVRRRVSVSGEAFSNYRAPVVHSLAYLDEPETTSSQTYSLRLGHAGSGTLTVYVNRNGEDSDSTRNVRTASSIVAIEVAA
jgi:hypothetical protein